MQQHSTQYQSLPFLKTVLFPLCVRDQNLKLFPLSKRLPNTGIVKTSRQGEQVTEAEDLGEDDIFNH